MKPSLYTFPSFPPLIQIYSALSTKETRSTDNFLKEIFPELSTSCKILLHRYCGNFLYHPPFPLADPDLSFFLEPSNHFSRDFPDFTEVSPPFWGDICHLPLFPFPDLYLVTCSGPFSVMWPQYKFPFICIFSKETSGKYSKMTKQSITPNKR